MEDKILSKSIRKVIVAMLLFILVLFTIFMLMTFIFNFIYEIFSKTFLTGSVFNPDKIDLTFSTLTTFSTVLSLGIVFIVIASLSFIATSVLVFKLITNYGRLKKNQKGSSRFTNLKEIQAQYRAVPDKADRFEGSGGVPIARYKEKLYIDDSPVNNLIIGTTRSGKGETVVFSTIDIYSRAKEQASMVINDPKGELFSASKDTLENLGYNVEILNLMTPEQSMSYNLLQQTVDAFVSEDYALAEQHARSIGFMLYNDPHAKDPVWWKSSASLCTALILGLCEQCKDEPEKITMYNVALMLSDLGSRTVFVLNINLEKPKLQEVNALDHFFSQFPNNHPAKLQFSTVNFSTGQMRASILANTNSELDIFTVNGIAKLTSETTFNTSKLGYKRWIKAKTTPNQRVHITFSDGTTDTIRTNSEGIFSIHFESTFSINDELLISVGSEKIKVKVTGTERKVNVNGEQIFEGYYKTTSSSDKLKVIELVQYEKPTALFMVTPDYDATFNIIVSIFIKQVYSDLARIASNIKGGKCQREVVFLLDEFGNMPTIEDFTNIITVCLGRNIRFNLVIQAYSQLEDKYGEGWKTIDGNCGNTMYLLTADEDTAERVSKKLGEETIVTKSRTGQTISLSKSKTESVDSRRLMTATEVMALKEGEMIVLRVIKRQDINRKRIKSYPIYLSGKTSLKYRWEYLSDYYDTNRSINGYDIDCEHTMLDLDVLKVDFENNNYQLRQLNENENEYEENKEGNPEIESLEKTEQKSSNRAEVNENKESFKVVKSNQVMAKKQELLEKELSSEINNNIKVSDIFPKNLLLQVFNNDHAQVETLLEKGLMDFRDVVISYSDSKELHEKWIKKLLPKIDSAADEIRKQIEGTGSNE